MTKLLLKGAPPGIEEYVEDLVGNVVGATRSGVHYNGGAHVGQRYGRAASYARPW